MRFSCLVFLLTLWDASTDEISWCLRAGSLCHGNKWTLKAVDQVSHYLPDLFDLSYLMRLADWDMDGDLDAVVLMEDGLWLYKMIAPGQNFSGPFLLNDSALNVNENSYLEVADWNGDGFPDILFAEQVPTPDLARGCTADGNIRYFEQMDLESEMVLQERTGSNNPFDVISVPCPDRYTTLQLADWNADGKPDLFVYSPHFIKLRYFENHHGQLLEATHRYFEDLDFSIGEDGFVKEIQVTDWDGDGDQDMILLCKRCRQPWCRVVLRYIEQLADGTLLFVPDGWWQDISLESDAGQPFQMVDWNGDNTSDLAISGRIFERSPAEPSFTQREGVQNPFGGLAFSDGEPHLVDWDGDGDLDLLVVERYNWTHPVIRIFELLGNGELVEADIKYDHIPLVQNGKRSGLYFFDWNHDGDVDLAVLTADGTLHLFDNHEGVLQEVQEGLFLRNRSLGLVFTTTFHLVDWNGDGHLDVILGPHGGQVSYLEQVNGILMNRTGHPLTTIARVPPFDLSWKILDCDGDGDHDVVRFQSKRWGAKKRSGKGGLAANFDAGPYLASCSKRGDRLVCDNSCFAWQLRDTALEVGSFGHITIGDWDGDGDLDVVGIRGGHENPVLFFDQNFCVPPTPCSGIGMCQASGRCSCGKDRGLEDCSGCGASYYTVSKKPGLNIIHSCAPCPTHKNQACAGRGVCVDDLYAKALGDAWDVGNGSCICAATFLNVSGQFSRQTCAQGTCPGGFQEVLLPAQHLQHSRTKTCLETCLACEVCDAGSFASPGGQCESCHPGYFSPQGSDSCSPCPAGSSSRTLGAIECSLCSAGTYAPSGSVVCHECPEGTISVKAGSAQCEPCNSRSIFWVHADNQNLTCIRPSEQYLILLLFFASSSVCLFFVATAFAYRIPVSDISTQNDGTVVTTHGAHRVLQASSVNGIQVKATHVPSLSSPCSAEFISDERLKLYRDPEVGAVESAESSVGWIVLGMGSALRQTGYLQVPLMIWITVSLASAILAAATALLTPVTGGLALFCAFLVVAGQHLRQRFADMQTPISKSRQVFLKKVKKSKVEKRVDRGAARGVGYMDLLSFYKFFQSFIRHRSMYYVASNLVVPLTQEDQLSFAELVGPKRLTWFVSHFWGMAVPHFVESLQHHAMQVEETVRDNLSYWVCTFSIRQHGPSVVQEELGHGVIEQSSFYRAMWDGNCCGTALVLDSDVSPLQRIWCLFELFQTFRHEKDDSREANFQGLLLCTSTGVLSKGAGGTDVCMAIASKLACLDLQAAKASSEDDKQLIFALIERSGGFASMNKCVQKSVRHALLKVYSRFERDFSELVDALNTSGTPISSSEHPPEDNFHV